MKPKDKESIFLSDDEHIELLLAEYLELDKIVKKGETDYENLLSCYELILKELEEKAHMVSTYLDKSKPSAEDKIVFNKIIKAQ